MATNIMGLVDYVQNKGELGKQQGQQSRLSELASQSYTTPAGQQNALLGQMAQVSPQFAQQQQQQFQEQGDARSRKAAGAAKYVLSAVESGDQAAIQGAYRTVYPYLSELVTEGGGQAPPEQWDPSMAEGLHQILSAAGGQAGLGQELKSLRVGANGNYWAIQGNEFVDTGVKANPTIKVMEQAGVAPYGVVTAGGGVGDVMGLGTGGQPQPQTQPGGAIAGQGDATTRVNIEGLDPAMQSRMAQTASMMAQAGYPQAEIDAFMDAQLSMPRTAAPAQGAPSGPVRTPTAGEIEAQKQAAQLAYLPAQQAIETQGALARARGEAGIQTEALGERATQTAQIERRADLPKLRQQITDLRQLRNDLGTKYSTGPLNAVIPDMLQSADNQVFLTRVNEAVLDAASMLTGVISDKDMEFLRKATISMTNKEDANRDILDRKIRILESAEKQAQGGQSQGAGRRLKFNPATGRIE